MNEEELIKNINLDLQIQLPESSTYDQLHQQLAVQINHIIKTDFQQLVSCLYRIDVNEGKLKQLLKQHPNEDAGNIIASLVIERQQEKIRTRKQFNQQPKDIDEEKW